MPHPVTFQAVWSLEWPLIVIWLVTLVPTLCQLGKYFFFPDPFRRPGGWRANYTGCEAVGAGWYLLMLTLTLLAIALLPPAFWFTALTIAGGLSLLAFNVRGFRSYPARLLLYGWLLGLLGRMVQLLGFNHWYSKGLAGFVLLCATLLVLVEVDNDSPPALERSNPPAPA